MHFRLYRDVEFGLGNWRARDDFLGIMPFEKEAQSAPASAVPASFKPSSVAATKTSESEPPSAAAAQELAHQPHPKRVSFTAEETAAPGSPASTSGGHGGDTEAETPLQVAEILRQMSQISTSPSPVSVTLGAYKKRARAHSVTVDTDERMDALQTLVKHKLPIPTGFKHQLEMAQTSRAPKRVRWLPPSSAFATTPRDTNSLKDPLTVRDNFPKITVLRPMPGLSSYDVLIGQESDTRRWDFVSHFNLGNRRLMVLASSYLEKFSAGTTEEQDKIIGSLYKTTLSAGGRFVEMKEPSNSYTEIEEAAAKDAVGKVLRNQLKYQKAGRNIVQMFHKDCSYIWGDDATPIEDLDKKPAARPDQEESEDNSADADDWRKGVRRMEPMTPLEPEFKPGPFDVICCRGSGPKSHPGNKYFVTLVEQNCERYIQAKGKMAKSVIVSEILDVVRKNSPSGGFVKKNDVGRYCETGDHLAREKIGQCFRDRLHTRYSSSSKAKLQKRRHSKSLSDDLSQSG